MLISVDIKVCGEQYRVEIQNDCTGNEDIGNYNVQLREPGFSGRVLKRVHVEGHKRGDWKRLLSEVFAELSGSANDGPQKNGGSE